jgi:hypothetical protein
LQNISININSMKKLTAAGMHWGQVNDPFDDAVDRAYEIVKKYGVSRFQIEQDMQGIKRELEKPGCDTERLIEAFLAGLRDIFNNPPVPQ